MSQTILRFPDVISKTGCPRSTVYLRIKQGLFPKPVILGPRSVGWPAGDIAALNAARIAGKSDEEIRQLVERIQAGRKRCSNEGR